MARLTITLAEDRHRALKQAAARRGRTLGELIDEALDVYGIKSEDEAIALIAKAHRMAQMREQEAEKLAVSETRAVRRR
ncbi:MAG: CopG family transcriptional regulator [Acidobacteriota bacterium]